MYSNSHLNQSEVLMFSGESLLIMILLLVKILDLGKVNDICSAYSVIL